MGIFKLSSSRRKLILAVCLSFLVTKLTTPILGQETPLTPSWEAITQGAKTLVGNTQFKLPELVGISRTEQVIPTLIPTAVYIAQPTATVVLPTPSITPVHLPQTLTAPPSLPTEAEIESAVTPQHISDMREATKKPRPTKKPTAIPFKLSNPRPGKNFLDAAEIVGSVMCVPPAMIMATLEIEYGAWMGDVEANWVERNTYSGSDPHDKSGSTAIPFGVVVQMMEDTWHRIKPYVGQKLGSSELSLAVTFDAMAAGAYHLRNISLAGQDKISCTDWPVKYILYGSCRYNGACAAGSHTYNDYAYKVCAAYNRYTTGAKKNCQ